MVEASTNRLILALTSSAHHTVAERGDIGLRRGGDYPVHAKTKEGRERYRYAWGGHVAFFGDFFVFHESSMACLDSDVDSATT